VGTPGRKPNDPAGPKGINTLTPGQHRRYGNVLVYMKTTTEGGYTVTFENGCIAWYRYPEDVTAAAMAKKPLIPDRQPDIIEIAGRTYEQAVARLIRRPDSEIPR